VKKLLVEVRRLRQAGTSIIYISHRLEEIFRVADRVTVLRDGRKITCLKVADATQREVAGYIIGQTAPDLFTPKAPSASTAQSEILLAVEGLEDPHLSPVTFDVRKGEVVGIAGLGSSGRSRLLKLLFGALQATSGDIRLKGQRLTLSSPRDALDAGIALVTEDRNFDGFVQTLPVGANITLPWLHRFRKSGILHTGAERKTAQQRAAALEVKMPSITADMSQLSGGNQQKALFSRWTGGDINLMLLDEPTHGVDIGSKAQIYQIIRDIVANGAAALIVSSEIEELEALCDRVLLIRDGALFGQLQAGDISKQNMLHRLLEQDQNEGTEV